MILILLLYNYKKFDLLNLYYFFSFIILFIQQKETLNIICPIMKENSRSILDEASTIPSSAFHEYIQRRAKRERSKREYFQKNQEELTQSRDRDFGIHCGFYWNFFEANITSNDIDHLPSRVFFFLFLFLTLIFLMFTYFSFCGKDLI
jgi:hypothetical protein